MIMEFMEGSISEKATGLGLNKLYYTTMNDAGLANSFGESKWHVMGIIHSCYDVKHYDTINGKDIFFLHDMRLKSNHTYVREERDIRDALDAIRNDKNVGYAVDDKHTFTIANRDGSLIREAMESIDMGKAMGRDYEHYAEETIFWDVINHFIVIVGRENLERFACALEEERNDFLFEDQEGKQIKDGTLTEEDLRKVLGEEYAEKHMSPLSKKMFKLAKESAASKENIAASAKAPPFDAGSLVVADSKAVEITSKAQVKAIVSKAQAKAVDKDSSTKQNLGASKGSAATPR